MKSLLLTLCMLSGPVLADCPPAPDISAQLDALIAEAHEAQNDMAGREISGQMWALWLTAPDEIAQTALDQGMRARSSHDFLGALDAFTRLSEYCPDYAEGFNQRAFIHFLREDYDAALVDLDRALVLSPRHAGAQSGRALTLMNLGRLAEARLQLLEALKTNPWLSERYLMAEGGPLSRVGEDI
jgi:tetratricopeptide (TPR) repeat protein